MSRKNSPDRWQSEFPWLPEKVRDFATTSMQFDSFKAALMFAPRLKGDHVHALPPGRPAAVIHLDRLPGAPKDWVRSRGSYVVPVESEIGIWFDFRNGEEADANTAVLLSIKGMNPITGKKLDALRLESYVEKCPAHGEPFKGENRLCEKCGYEWPPQGYLTMDSTLWWDGWTQNGHVRQFFFTDEDERDIASLVIGKDSVVPAFGFAFWQPKNLRVVERAPRMRGWPGELGGGTWTVNNGTLFGGDLVDGGPQKMYFGSKGSSLGASTSDNLMSFTSSLSTPTNFSVNYCSTDIKCLSLKEGMAKRPGLYTEANDPAPEAVDEVPERSRTVSVGAGAKIDQKLAKDSLGVEGWKDEPSGIIRIYFAFKDQFLDLIAGGVAELEGDKEGYLKNLPVG